MISSPYSKRLVKNYTIIYTRLKLFFYVPSNIKLASFQTTFLAPTKSVKNNRTFICSQPESKNCQT